jgi:hypothetical protein
MGFLSSTAPCAFLVDLSQESLDPNVGNISDASFQDSFGTGLDGLLIGFERLFDRVVARHQQ